MGHWPVGDHGGHPRSSMGDFAHRAGCASPAARRCVARASGSARDRLVCRDVSHRAVGGSSYVDVNGRCRVPRAVRLDEGVGSVRPATIRVLVRLPPGGNGRVARGAGLVDPSRSLRGDLSLFPWLPLVWCARAILLRAAAEPSEMGERSRVCVGDAGRWARRSRSTRPDSPRYAGGGRSPRRDSEPGRFVGSGSQSKAGLDRRAGRGVEGLQRLDRGRLRVRLPGGCHRRAR